MSRAAANKAPSSFSLTRLIRFFLAFLVLLFIMGFLGYVLHVVRLTPVEDTPRADGIIVLTGTGGGRIEAGADLLRGGYGERLLISGVARETTAKDVQALTGLDDELFECCVDLGYEAQNTIGNANEAANWAAALGYDHILLVTSDYHMPRARIELSKKMAGIQMTPYPVAPPDVKKSDWWRSGPVLSRLGREYVKLVIIYIRDAGQRGDRPAPTVPLEETAENP